MAHLTDDDLRKLLDAFLEEASEALARLEADLLAIESDLSDSARLQAAFRTVHTLKGDAGFLNLRDIETLAHLMEDIFVKAREGTLFLTRAAVGALLKACDAMSRIADHLREHGEEGGPNSDAIAKRLRALLETSGHEAREIVRARGTLVVPKADAPSAKDKSSSSTRIIPSGKGRTWGLFSDEDDLPDQLVDAPSEEQELQAIPAEDQRAEPEPAPTQAQPEAAQPPTTPAQRSQKAESLFSTSVRSQSPSVRLDLQRLEHMVDLISELVIARNQLLLRTRNSEDPRLRELMLKTDRITCDLQSTIMNARLQPVSTLFDKFPRIVRDFNDESGKQIQLVIEGADTELDRSLIEAMRDPLVHMVRNACGHGVESPADRVAEGKPANGTLTLYARHEEGRVIIGVEDDGAGMDPDRIRTLAIERGVVLPMQAESMSDSEICALIFQPGFSTAGSVTKLSGRGVGMDVVRASVERAGGTVRMETTIGHGTRFELQLPLTLAIFPALMVEAGGQTFALPQACVREALNLEALEEVEYVQDEPVIRHRDKLLPLRSLAEALNLPPSDPRDTGADALVIRSGEDEYVLHVDGLGEVEEVVIKPLTGSLAKLPYYLGATLDAEGRARLILDPQSIAKHRSDAAPALQRAAKIAGGKEQGISATESMLVFQLGEDGRCAIPLELVSRVEEIKRNKIEFIAGQHYTQYRGRAMPLVNPASMLNYSPATTPADPELQSVMLFDVDGRHAGLMIERVIDIVEVPLAATNMTTAQRGVRGSALIDGKTTLIVDALELLSWDRPGFLLPYKENRVENQGRGRVLLVDTSPFYKIHIESYLRAAGFTVYSHADPDAGLQAARMGEFDLLVVDIGLLDPGNAAFIETVRAMPERRELPALALTKESESSAINALLKAGFNRHLTKLDYRELLKALDEMVGAARALQASAAGQIEGGSGA